MPYSKKVKKTKKLAHKILKFFDPQTSKAVRNRIKVMDETEKAIKKKRKK